VSRAYEGSSGKQITKTDHGVPRYLGMSPFSANICDKAQSMSGGDSGLGRHPTMRPASAERIMPDTVFCRASELICGH
jgi:hypothetical protein